MKQKLNLEIVATEQEEEQIQALINTYNLSYDAYYNPEENFYYIQGLEIGERLLLLLKLTGAEIYTSESD